MYTRITAQHAFNCNYFVAFLLEYILECIGFDWLKRNVVEHINKSEMEIFFKFIFYGWVIIYLLIKTETDTCVDCFRCV